MSIELSSEDLKSAEALLSQGRFASIEDAVGAGLRALLVDHEHLRWDPELQSSVDAGVAAVGKKDFAAESDVDALFLTYQQKSA